MPDQPRFNMGAAQIGEAGMGFLLTATLGNLFIMTLGIQLTVSTFGGSGTICPMASSWAFCRSWR